MTTACCQLSCVAAYNVSTAGPSQFPFQLIISRGSVVDFAHANPKAAIVNAANEGCLGGGGVDGAINNAGGPNLYEDRHALPMIGHGIRCKTGSAVITGPNTYGKLHTSYVIHAVGPNYMQYSADEGDALLSSAYSSSMDLAKNNQLEAVAFSLLSSGIYRGARSRKDVLRVGVDAIKNFHGYAELQEVHMCAFSEIESRTLIDIAKEMGLQKDGDSCACTQCNLL